MSDQATPRGDGIAHAGDMLDLLEQARRDLLVGAAGWDELASREPDPAAADGQTALAGRMRDQAAELTLEQAVAWYTPAEVVPIREQDPNAPVDVKRARHAGGWESLSAYSADTPEDSERVKGMILKAAGFTRREIRAANATPPEPHTYTVDGEAPVRPASSTASVIVAPRPRSVRRSQREHPGRRQTRRGPPADDEPSHQPAGCLSQHPGREATPRDYSTTPLAWKGIGRVTLSLAGVTARRDQVRIPYRLADGSEHNARIIAGRRCWWERRGLELVPFGLEQLPSAARSARSVLFVCEGESDALTIRDQVAEHAGRTAYAIGLPGANTWRAEWASIAARFERVYLVPDADAAGERMARLVLADVEWARRVCLPTGEDTRSVIRSYGVGRFCAFIDQADRDAVLWDAIRTADTLAEFDAILRGRAA